MVAVVIIYLAVMFGFAILICRGIHAINPGREPDEGPPANPKRKNFNH